MGRKKLPDRAWYRLKDHRGQPRWQLCIVRGGRAPETTLLAEGATERDAERAVKIAVAEMSAGRWERPDDWADAITAFLGHRRQQGDREISLSAIHTKLIAVARTLGGDPLALSAADASRHRDVRLAEGRSPATIRQEIRYVAQMQRWFVAQGWVRVATWTDAPLPSGQRGKRLLQEHEFGPWLRAAEELGRERRPWARWPAVAWLLVHGLRVGEIHALLVEDLNLMAGAVHLVDRPEYRLKSESSQRVVVLSDDATACLRSTFRGAAVRSESPAFPRPCSGERFSVKDEWIRLMVQRTCERAGVPRVCPHSFRHDKATIGEGLGISLSALGRGLGHSNPNQTLTYAHARGVSRGVVQPYLEFLDRSYRARASLELVEGGGDGASDGMGREGEDGAPDTGAQSVNGGGAGQTSTRNR